MEFRGIEKNNGCRIKQKIGEKHMSLSWNEIKTRAAAFVNEWKDIAPTAREEADVQTFGTGFFHIFGVKAPFSEPSL